LFQSSLLAVCTDCILKSLNFNSLKFSQVLSLMNVDSYDFLKVSESFVRALSFSLLTEIQVDNSCQKLNHSFAETRSSLIGLPEILRRHLQKREELILDCLLWISTSGGVTFTIKEMQQRSKENDQNDEWPLLSLKDVDEFEYDMMETVNLKTNTNYGNQHLAVSYVFRKLLNLSARRIFELSRKLCITSPVLNLIWKAWKYVLREKVSLLYDRYIDQPILCVIYGVCRMIEVVPEVSFYRIVESYNSMNPRREKLNHTITKNVKIGTTEIDYGNVIMFYNIVFIPAMKSHLFEYKKYDFLKMQEQKMKKEVKTVDDATMIADVAVGTVSILHELGGRKRNNFVSPYSFSSTGNVPESMTKVGNSKIYISTSAATMSPVITSDKLAHFGVGRLASMKRNFATYKTKAIYNFGENSRKRLSLVNRTVQFGINTSPNDKIRDQDSDSVFNASTNSSF